MKEIQLSQNGKQAGQYVAIVDDADYARVSAMKWHSCKNYSTRYAQTTIQKSGRKKNIQMHRFILDAPAGFDVDHVNGNGLDNRRDNLRLCTRSQNCMNKKRPSHNLSGYKGVSFSSGKWKATIYLRIDGKPLRVQCGRFTDKVSAAMAYDAAAIRYFGEFAHLNFPK